MKLCNVQVSGRLRDSPAAIFKVNQLSVTEDEKSILLSTMNNVNGCSSNQAKFDHCFDQYSQYSDVVKGMDCPKYLKQLLHGYNAAIVSVGVGESEVPGSRVNFIMENLDCLQKLMDQNSYRYDCTLSFSVFGLSDGHCVDLLGFQKLSPLEVAEFLQDYDSMEPASSVTVIKDVVKRGYTLPMVLFVHLKTEARNELESSAANVSVLCLADLGSINNPSMERSFAHLRSIVLTLDQPFVSGELRVRDAPLTHLLSPFIGGNANTLFLIEFLTNAAFQTVSDGFLFSESLRRVKNRVEQNFENFLAVEVDELWEDNARLCRERDVSEQQFQNLNASLSRLQLNQEALERERDSLTAGSESRRFLLEYNASRMEVEKLEVKEQIRALRLEILQADHQKALESCQGVDESICRRRTENELHRIGRQIRDSEQFYHSQISNLRDRIGQASDELQRSVEERSIMQSKLQNAQHRIEQLNDQLRNVESSRSHLERTLTEQKMFDSKFSSQTERAKTTLEMEIQTLRRQLELARESERTLTQTVSRVEGRSDLSRRELGDFERELRALRAENALLHNRLEGTGSVGVGSVAPSSDRLRGVIDSLKSRSEVKAPAAVVAAAPSEATSRRSKRKSETKTTTAASAATATTETQTTVQAPTSPSKTNTQPATYNPDVKGSSLTVSADSENSFAVNSLPAILDGRKKIKLPQRSGMMAGAGAVNSIDIPRSTPLSKSVDPSVMSSIMSNFTVKLPTVKK